MKKAGFTLIEILIVMAILAMMAVIMTGILNPKALTGRGNDARRKKDLARIRVAFEEYFNDIECYPTETIIDNLGLQDRSSCGTGAFSPWLASWPCDPNGQPYYVFVEPGSCPRWVRLVVNLENKKDNDIPEGWYGFSGVMIGSADSGLTVETANYGASSSNVWWYERTGAEVPTPTNTTAPELPVGCGGFGTGCNYRPPGGGCNYAGISCTQGADNCYLSEPTDNCLDRCKVTCCNNGLPCE